MANNSIVRIDKLVPGSLVDLDFHSFRGSLRGPYTERAIFLGIVPATEQTDREAKFLSVRKDGTYSEFRLYRDNGRWVAGSSAQRVTIDYVSNTVVTK